MGKAKGEVLPVYGCRDGNGQPGEAPKPRNCVRLGVLSETLWKELRDARDKS